MLVSGNTSISQGADPGPKLLAIVVHVFPKSVDLLKFVLVIV